MFKKSLLLSTIVIALSSPASAQDAAKGETVFKKCAACHAVGEGAKNKVGLYLMVYLAANLVPLKALTIHPPINLLV